MRFLLITILLSLACPALADLSDGLGSVNFQFVTEESTHVTKLESLTEMVEVRSTVTGENATLIAYGTTVETKYLVVTYTARIEQVEVGWPI